MTNLRILCYLEFISSHPTTFNTMLKGFASNVVSIPYKYFKGPEPTSPPLNLENITSLCQDLAGPIIIENVDEIYRNMERPEQVPVWVVGSGGANSSTTLSLFCEEVQGDFKCPVCGNPLGRGRWAFVEGSRYHCEVIVGRQIPMEVGLQMLDVMGLIG